MAIAICLPVTSSGQHSTTPLERLKNLKFDENALVYIGIDDDDDFYNDKNAEFFGQVFEMQPQKIKIWRSGKKGEIPLLAIYCHLMKMGLEDGCEYFTMWGDDINLCSDTSKDWLPKIKSTFHSMSKENNTPYGIGVVSLVDISSPNFPTFPVLHKTHFEIFGKFIDTTIFSNTDADPFIFEIYRPFGLSRFQPDVRICNTIGGTDALPRYEKQHVLWKDEVLKQGIASVKRYLESKNVCMDLVQKTTIGVVVPTYRVDVDLIRNIVHLKAPQGFCKRTYVICDNDNLDNDTKLRLKHLEQEAPDLRVRFNTENLGASGTRNRGIDESSEEWIAFFDDDLDVSKNYELLTRYCERIKEDGDRASGFVGPTKFPPVMSPMQAGVVLSGITYFWGIANCMPSPPWGVTANLCARRTKVRFHSDFIKTGGGEDIAFCLDTVSATGMPLLAAPKALALHPWWEGGDFSAKRFYNWTQGDGLLVDKYPNLTYYTMPNVIEWSFFTLIGVLLFQIQTTLLFLVWVWIVEFLFDAVRTIRDEKTSFSELFGGVLTRSLFRTWVKNHVEFGHLWVHLKRGKLFNVCCRFDWFCEKCPEAPTTTKRSHIYYNLFVLVPWLVVVGL